MIHIIGTAIIEAQGAALNNAGKDPTSEYANAVATKKIRSPEGWRPYRSGQSTRYMLREMSREIYDWKASPVTKLSDKQAITEANPISYPDDDIYGYMSAQRVATGEKNAKGKDILKEMTFTRVSPLKIGDAIGLPINPIKEQCVMRRDFESDSILYSREQYANYLRMPFALNVGLIGTFTAQDKPGCMNISEKMCQELEQQGLKIAEKTYRLQKDERKLRTRYAIEPLKSMRGGAVQATLLSDSTPRMIAIVATSGGSLVTQALFPHRNPMEPLINADAIMQMIKDCGNSFKSKLYIGIQPGFAQKEEKEVLDLKNEKLIIAESPANAIDRFLEEIMSNDEIWK
jgi:CRISPR-associated protein Cst2